MKCSAAAEIADRRDTQRVPEYSPQEVQYSLQAVAVVKEVVLGIHATKVEVGLLPALDDLVPQHNLVDGLQRNYTSSTLNCNVVARVTAAFIIYLFATSILCLDIYRNRRI